MKIENRFLFGKSFLLFGSFILLLFIPLACIQENPAQLLISNVNIIDVSNGTINRNRDLVVRQGRISMVKAHGTEKILAEERLDGTGKYLIPGLFDCHVHTTDYQSDFPRFVRFGVTGVFVTGGSRCTDQYYEEMRRTGDRDSSMSPRVFHTSQHFTMEGRHPVKTYGGSHWEEGKTVYYLRDTHQIETLVEKVAVNPILGIKITIEDGPHPPLVDRMPIEFIRKVVLESHKNNLEVFAHVSDNIELELAVEAGVRNVVHFTGVDIDFSRDTALLSRIYSENFDWVTTLMLDKSFLYPLHPEWMAPIVSSNIYDPQMIDKMNDPGYRFRSQDYISFMREYLNLDSITLKDVIAFQVEDIQTLYEKGVNFVLGTDTGNDFIFPGYSLHEEMQLLELGGMAPADILKMATINAAKMMHAEDRFGSIEEGKVADMILLENNPLEQISHTLSIQKVFKGGHSF